MPRAWLSGRVFHDREDFYVLRHIKVFAIMEAGRPAGDREQAGLQHDRG
jgi:hypothetical protein